MKQKFYKQRVLEAGNRCSYRELDGVKILQRLGYHILSLSLAGMKDKCYD